MAHQRAPKQWALTKNETITSFNAWRQNLVYILSLDPGFAPLINTNWQKKTAANPNRGYTNDGAGVDAADRRRAVQKAYALEMMLGQVANFCPIISRNSIVKNSTSLDSIWQKIRLHFGFQSSGAHFLDFCNIKLQADEKPEDLFQRLTAFVEDNLLTTAGGIKHHGEDIAVDEELSPTLENTVVSIWLQLLHPGLPELVKQRFGAELRNQTVASLRPEISQSLNSLLDELRSIEDTRALRTYTSNLRKPRRVKT